MQIVSFPETIVVHSNIKQAFMTLKNCNLKNKFDIKIKTLKERLLAHVDYKYNRNILKMSAPVDVRMRWFFNLTLKIKIELQLLKLTILLHIFVYGRVYVCMYSPLNNAKYSDFIPTHHIHKFVHILGP